MCIPGKKSMGPPVCDCSAGYGNCGFEGRLKFGTRLGNVEDGGGAWRGSFSLMAFVVREFGYCVKVTLISQVAVAELNNREK